MSFSIPLTDTPITYRARYVVPMTTAEPIPHGTVTVDNGMIVDVGTKTAGPIHDLGNVALMPGLINAHTHLELSGPTQPLGRPGIGFDQWIESVLDYRQSDAYQPESALVDGVRESVRLGTRVVADIAQDGWPTGPFEEHRLHAIGLLELIGWNRAMVPDCLARAERFLKRMATTPFCQAGLSPHAPHTVCGELLDKTIALSAEKKVPLAMHLAETQEEIELLRTGAGPLRKLMDRTGPYDPAESLVGTRPLDYLKRLAQADRALVIHGNYLDAEEIAFLADRSERMAVVFCPRCHDWFGHPRWPLPEMLAAGVKVAVGTDSRATTADLSVLAELRQIRRRYPELDRRTMVRMGTEWAAEALGLDEKYGTLKQGKVAAMTAVELGEKVEDVYESILK